MERRMRGNSHVRFCSKDGIVKQPSTITPKELDWKHDILKRQATKMSRYNNNDNRNNNRNRRHRDANMKRKRRIMNNEIGLQAAQLRESQWSEDFEAKEQE